MRNEKRETFNKTNTIKQAVIKIEQLEKLKDYETASWAIWSEEFPEKGCIERRPKKIYQFIRDEINKLNPNVVLLSLNPSAVLCSPFANFHSVERRHNDHILKKYIQDDNLKNIKGAYMTDLVEEPNPDSEEIEPEEEDIKHFLEQLNILGRKRYLVICFTGKTFNTLRKYFGKRSKRMDHGMKTFSTGWDGKYVEFYQVWFYGIWGKYQKEKRKELKRQLRYLNKRLDSSISLLTFMEDKK